MPPPGPGSTEPVKFSPFCRLCAAWGVSLAVILGEEHEHLHVEAEADTTQIADSNIVMTTSAVSTSLSMADLEELALRLHRMP
jgi:hypothetical protein